MLNAAIIGYGGIAKAAHLPGYKELEKLGKVKLVAAYDVRPETFKTKAEINIGSSEEENGSINYYTDLEEMLSKEDIDLIDICTPTYLHKQYAIDMLNRGYLVLSEKPMALSSADCEEMVAASEGRLMIGQCLRFAPEYLYAKKLIDEGTYGKPIQATFRRLSGAPMWGFENWFMDVNRSGGVLFDMHIHDVDIARFLFGEPEAVSCVTLDHICGDSVAHSRLLYKDMAVFAQADWTQEHCPFLADYRIGFEKANIICSGGQVTVYPYEGESFQAVLPEDGMYMKEIEYLADIYVNGEPNLQNPPESAAKSIKLAEALRESARKGGEIVKFEA